MEARESVQHKFLPLEDGWFIDEAEYDHAWDYWLGKTGSDERTYLSDRYEEALKLATKKIGGYRQ